MADQYYREVAISFRDGTYVLNFDGVGTARCYLTADLTGGVEGWLIASIYLESIDNGDRDRLTGPLESMAANVLYSDPKFTAWAEAERGMSDRCCYEPMDARR